jgi:predicted RNase H-like HicB family nuclease
VAVGDTLDEVQANIADAIAAPIKSLRTRGEAVPPPSTTTSLVDVAT